jgi:hypothetical protein
VRKGFEIDMYYRFGNSCPEESKTRANIEATLRMANKLLNVLGYKLK